MFNDFANKVFRDAFLEENIKNRLAFQVRALREKQSWSQPELGKRAHKTQSGISRIEDPTYGKFTIRTLLDLASVFDVALFIGFVPYTKLISELKDVSPEALAVASYKDEKNAIEESSTASSIAQSPVEQLSIQGYRLTTTNIAELLYQKPSQRSAGSALESALEPHHHYSTRAHQYMPSGQAQGGHQSMGARP